MKAASYVAVFVGGWVVCFLLASHGVDHAFADDQPVMWQPNANAPWYRLLFSSLTGKGVPISQATSDASLSTYLSFLGVMLTMVTVVLTALAIVIGIVAAFTIAGIKEEVRKSAAKLTSDTEKKVADAIAAVDRKTEETLSERAINDRINKITFAMRQTPTAAELEKGFDPEDDGNR